MTFPGQVALNVHDLAVVLDLAELTECVSRAEARVMRDVRTKQDKAVARHRRFLSENGEDCKRCASAERQGSLL